ncbi:hypothetical protein Taro_024704 [Colocasia esculenta]|uniref:VLRF1 domain-containing protein n=1 Tax=Colocasia esculenta TaxID=4460 RepID=A0A843VL59_COLES|nr:hypothetical protein [Colocasia esculenta]
MASREPVAPPAYLSRSIFDLPPTFFDSSRLLSDPREIPAQRPHAPPPPSPAPPLLPPGPTPADGHGELQAAGAVRAASGWTCHSCEMEFESLQDQRFHFKSDLHRLNVKLYISGKKAIKEEDFNELGDESLFKEYDVSSISGSEDDSDSSLSIIKTPGQERELARQKIYIHLQSGETVSLWRCLLLNDSEDLSFKNSKLGPKEKVECVPCVTEYDLIGRLRSLTQEPRDKTHFLVLLLYRYVVRAKAGKKQSAKDATGKAANSAGSQLRRYNEAALKKEIHELLDTWRPYFDVSSCIFIYAPSKNHQLLFDGDKPAFDRQDCVVRHIPITVRRPTLKEAKRIYNLLTYLVYEIDKDKHSTILGDSTSCAEEKENSGSPRLVTDKGVVTSVLNEGTPLHEAAKLGDALLTLELLEQGLDPCLKDARGRTPYMLALEKEVRNTFRRFMALNLDKWDWHAANVPSPLTKEMEESQAAKQAEKDAKRKAKAKESKKLRKAKETAKLFSWKIICLWVLDTILVATLDICV